MMKKGVIGKFVALPTAVFVIIICVLFVGWFFLADKVSDIGSLDGKLDTEEFSDAFFDEVNVGEAKDSVIGVILGYHRGKLNREEAGKAFKGLIGTSECVAVAKGLDANPGADGNVRDRDDFVFMLQDGEIVEETFGNSQVLFSNYEGVGKLEKAYLDLGPVERLYVEYYLGECIR